MAAKTFEKKCSALSVSRYVGILHDMTQLSTNTVVALVSATLVSVLLSSGFGISLLRHLYSDYRRLFLVIDPNVHS